MIILIAAVAEDGGIGYENGLPWPKNEEDMEYFKNKTLGNIVLMGHNTWNSLPNSVKPLDGRSNWVISSKFVEPPEANNYITVFSSVEQALDSYKRMLVAPLDMMDLYIIGGATIYRQTMDLVDEAMITYIPGDFKADTFMPPLSDDLELVKYVKGKTVGFYTYSRREHEYRDSR